MYFVRKVDILNRIYCALPDKRSSKAHQFKKRLAQTWAKATDNDILEWASNKSFSEFSSYHTTGIRLRVYYRNLLKNPRKL